jgi:hypothetical protein
MRLVTLNALVMAALVVLIGMAKAIGSPAEDEIGAEQLRQAIELEQAEREEKRVAEILKKNHNRPEPR